MTSIRYINGHLAVIIRGISVNIHGDVLKMSGFEWKPACYRRVSKINNPLY